MAMRFKALGLGVLAIGGASLVASASLAMIPAADRPDSPAPQAEAKPARSWVQTLPGGAKVRLVGVSPHPSGPATWKTPDGAPLTPPYDPMGYVIQRQEGRKAWEFALRVTDLPDPRASYRWEIKPSVGASASWRPTAALGEVVPGLGSVGVSLPADRRSCTVRAGVASGNWTTVFLTVPSTSWLTRDRFNIVFAEPTEIPTRSARDGGRTSLTLTHDILDDDVRVVAVDHQGKEASPVRVIQGPARTFQQLTVGFDLPLASIREFWLQTRPFEWAEFTDVPVDPAGR